MQDASNTGGKPVNPTDLTSPVEFGKTLLDAITSNAVFLKGLQEIDNQAFSIAKKFGLTKSEIDNIKAATTLATDELVKYGGAQDTAYKQQLVVGKELGRNLILSADIQKSLFLAAQTSGQPVESMVKGFKDAGVSLTNVGKQMNNVINTAREIGVNAEVVSSKVLANTGKLNLYNFQGGVEGLAKMAANAAALRIDMGDTLKFAEKVYSPEGAIEAAAALQRLGVAQSDLLDPLKLLDLAENDPTELQNQIAEMSKQFVKLNKDGNFEILPGAKRQLREIEQVLGYGTGELSKMALSSAEAGDKMSKIKFPDFATEEQKKLLANISEMEKGEIKIKTETGYQDINTVLSSINNKEQLEKLLEQGKELKPEQLVEAQMSATENLTKAIESLRNRLPRALARTEGGQQILDLSVTTVKALTDSIGNKIDENQNKIVSVSNETFKGISENLTKFAEGTGGINSLVESLKIGGNGIIEMTKILTPAIGQYAEAAKKMLNASNETAGILTKIQESDVFKKLMEGAGKSTATGKPTEQGGDVLITPDKNISLNPQDTFIAGTGLEFMKDLIKPNSQPAIVQSITNSLGIDPNQFKNMLKTTTESTTKTESPSEITVNFKMSLDVSGSNAASIDTNKLMMVLNDQGVKEKIIQVTKDALTERGQKILYPS
jgi:hypothetical protein